LHSLFKPRLHPIVIAGEQAKARNFDFGVIAPFAKKSGLVKDASAARLPYQDFGVQELVRRHFSTHMTALLPNAARPLSLDD